MRLLRFGEREQSRGTSRQTDTHKKKVVGSGVVLSNASLKEERIETLATTVRYVVPMARKSKCRAGWFQP